MNFETEWSRFLAQGTSLCLEELTDFMENWEIGAQCCVTATATRHKTYK